MILLEKLKCGIQRLSSKTAPPSPGNQGGDPPKTRNWTRTLTNFERILLFIFALVSAVAAVLALIQQDRQRISVVTEIADATETSSPTDTGTATATKTAIGTSTGTAISPTTQTPIGTWDPATLEFNSITQNVDWTPVEKNFGGVIMVLVPAGCFDMGSDEYAGDARPSHQICFADPFWIDRYEVRNSEFADSGIETQYPSGSSDPNNPRTQVSWLKAREYCTSRDARLPTEAEWEYAARGPDNLLHPWGNEWEPSYTVWLENSNDKTAHVESHPEGASWVGAFHMNGNVWEWVNSLLRDYPYDLSDGREDPQIAEVRIFRGGALDQREDAVNSISRFAGQPDGGYYNLGFRCARDFATD